MGAVVADGRCVDQELRALLGFGTGLNETMRGVDTTFLNASPLGWSPLFLRYRFAGKVDHPIGAVQSDVPLSERARRPMQPAFGSGVGVARRTAGKQDQCMTLRQELVA